MAVLFYNSTVFFMSMLYTLSNIASSNRTAVFNGLLWDLQLCYVNWQLVGVHFDALSHVNNVLSLGNVGLPHPLQH